MCARYVLMPSGETVVVPSENLQYLPNGAVVLNKKQRDHLKGLLKHQCGISKWENEPVFSYHVCPTDSGIIIIQRDKGRVAVNSAFSFQRKWKRKDGKMRSFVGNNFRSDNLLPKKYEELGFQTNRYSQGNSVFYPAFKNSQTCLVVLWGFVEFVDVAGRKVGYYTELRSGEPILAAGLYEEVDGKLFHTIGTVDPNEQMERIKHDRLISIVNDVTSQNTWLSIESSVIEKMKVFQSSPTNILHSWQVGPSINNPRNKRAEVIERVGEIIAVAA